MAVGGIGMISTANCKASLPALMSKIAEALT